ncbi:MAG: LysE family translocator [Giesbergeria sp.]|mgnify:CR=1 FL=1|nr:LysE family translocator [Giesbergeria sp.]
MLVMHEIFWFAMAAVALGCTPGPNMAYCLSRALCQGRLAGLLSLCGVLAAHGVYALATALGLTALLLTAPAAFDVVRCAGVAYLLWLAWKMLRPAKTLALPLHSAKPRPMNALSLFCMGFAINLLNPKTLLFYAALFPQFLKPERGMLFLQSLQLGAVQMVASGVVMGLLVCCASHLKTLVSGPHTGWQNAPRYVMGSVFVVLALRLVTLQQA